MKLAAEILEAQNDVKTIYKEYAMRQHEEEKKPALITVKEHKKSISGKAKELREGIVKKITGKQTQG